MKVLNLIAGSDEWKETRARYRTASEASAMMGKSKHMSRDELLHMKATGEIKEFSEWTRKNLLDSGHEIEAAARPLADEIIGDELFPITAVDDSGYLLASYDGANMEETMGWECKKWNEAKADDVRGRRVPEEDYWQVVQQLCVGIDKVLYMVTDGTPKKCVHVYKELSKTDRKQLMAGWEQFEKDLARSEEHTSELQSH